MAAKRKRGPRRQRFIGFQTTKRPRTVPVKRAGERALGDTLSYVEEPEDPSDYPDELPRS